MFQLTLAGWKYDELSAKVLRNKKIMPQALSIILGYLVCWSWHAYFKPKDHQIIGRPHGATILDRIMKNEIANPTPPPSHKSWMKPCKSQNAPFSDPCLEGRRYKFPIYFVQTSKTTWRNTFKYSARYSASIKILKTARWNSCPRQLSTTDNCEGKTTMTN